MVRHLSLYISIINLASFDHGTNQSCDCCCVAYMNLLVMQKYLKILICALIIKLLISCAFLLGYLDKDCQLAVSVFVVFIIGECDNATMSVICFAFTPGQVIINSSWEA